MTPVLLVSVPFAPLGYPSLGLALLQACLRERNIRSRVLHLGLDFGAEIGVSEYRLVVDELCFTPDLTGDWIFAEALRGTPTDPQPWLSEVLEGGHPAHRKPLRLQPKNPETVKARLLAIRAQAGAFLDQAAARIVEAAPKVLGLTSVFAQNAAALALAKRVKALDPSILVCLGGANAEGPMGEALFQNYECLDVVVSGEGELRFPPLVEARLEGRPLPRIEGVWAREALLDTSPQQQVGPVDLAELPTPEFGDFFAQLRETGLRPKVELPFETSRGCWWGQKHHCTFCGLNGGTMAFRRKPAAKALEELHTLRQRHPGRGLIVVDNILDMGYFRDFLPALAAQPNPPRLFFEVKANLTRQQLRLLKAAGVWRIQPGIESLSNDVLKRMRKGLRALHGIQLLRDGASFGLDIAWNILAGFPGEEPQDYARMTRMIPLLTHLQPPGFCSAIRLDRFSPLHSQPSASGLLDVQAFPAYAHVYDLPQPVLDRLAYYFSFRYADGRDVSQYFGGLEDAVDRWTARRGSLVAETFGDEVLVHDDRDADGVRQFRLAGAEAWVLKLCDQMQSGQRLRGLASLEGGPGAEALSVALDSLREKGLLLSDEDWHLALPLFPLEDNETAAQDLRLSA